MRTTATISELIKDFLREQDIAANSNALYRINLQLFFRWCHANGIDQRSVSSSNVVAYKSYLLSSGYSTLTINNRITTLHKFYKWMELNNYCDNPTLTVRSFKKYKGFKKDFLTDSQVSLMLSAIDRTTQVGLRDLAIIFLMLFNALREVEISRMKLSDIVEVGGSTIISIQGKGRFEKDEQLPLSGHALDALSQYLATRTIRSNDESLFVVHSYNNRNSAMSSKAISNVVNRYLLKSGVKSKRITPHSLRHTAAVRAIKSGASLYEVQLFLRHSSSNITQIYTKMIEAQIRLDKSPVRMLDADYGVMMNTNTKKPFLITNEV